MDDYDNREFINPKDKPEETNVTPEMMEFNPAAALYKVTGFFFLILVASVVFLMLRTHVIVDLLCLAAVIAYWPVVKYIERRIAEKQR